MFPWSLPTLQIPPAAFAPALALNFSMLPLILASTFCLVSKALASSGLSPCSQSCTGDLERLFTELEKT